MNYHIEEYNIIAYVSLHLFLFLTILYIFKLRNKLFKHQEPSQVIDFTHRLVRYKNVKKG